MVVYHSITEFVVNEYPEAKQICHFHARAIAEEGEEHGIIYECDIAHEQTIICRQLFAGHVVRSRPIKRMNSFH